MDRVTFASIPALLAITVPREDYDFWEKQFDKWGIALVSLLFFVSLAIVSWRREVARERRQIKREDEQQKERQEILTRMADSNDKLVILQTSSQYETRRQSDSNEALLKSIKDITLKMNCPIAKQ